MSLVACRACGHQVDTSALACPGCGATDPAKSISRQQRDGRMLVVQLVLGLSLLGFGGWYLWTNVIPLVKQYLVKPPA
jgi:hypothetical protein